jgi:hypothetical protein
MYTLSSLVDDLKSLDCLSERDFLELRNYAMLLSHKKNRRLRLHDLPSEMLVRIGNFLDVNSLNQFSSIFSSGRNLSDCFRDRGLQLFEGLVVDGKNFQQAVATTGEAFLEFQKFQTSLIFGVHPIIENLHQRLIRVNVPANEVVSFTLPMGFGVTSDTSLFLEFHAELHFGPDIIRSVIGVVEDLEDMEMDKAMSEKVFGLAYGPLSSILSSKGKYFDKVEAYITGPYIRDYLDQATQETVGLRLGIYFMKGQVAFYRQGEEDGDWECTGFVYKTEKPVLYPCFMFSKVTDQERLSFEFKAISQEPPFTPHANKAAFESENWLPFEDETVEALLGEDGGLGFGEREQIRG